MKVRTKLVLSMAAIATALVIPALYGLSRLHEVQQIASRLEGRHAEAQVALGELQDFFNRAEQLGRRYVALGEPAIRAELDTTFGGAAESIDRLRKAGYTEGADRLAARIDSVAADADRLYALVEDGQSGQATSYFEEFTLSLGLAREAASDVAAQVDTQSTAAAARAGRIGRRAIAITGIGVTVGFLLAGGLGLLITRDITVPLARLRAATEDVAEERFDASNNLALERHDELGTVSRAFASMRERLAELNQLRADLLGATSHRLKTPITVILGYTEMLAESAGSRLNSEEREYLSKVDEQVEELRERVDRLLELSRVEAGEFRVALEEEVPVRALLQDLTNGFEPLAHQRNISFSVNVEEAVPELVNVDPDRLRDDVLGNLLENAFEHTESGGRVRVDVRCGELPARLAEKGRPPPVGEPEPPTSEIQRLDEGEDGVDDWWVIRVGDTGAGIPSDELERIFRRYYQVDAERGGVGLGLAVARKVVEDHGGSIWAENEVGEGTSFYVRLPLG